MLDTRQYDKDLTDVYYNTGLYETLSEVRAEGHFGALWGNRSFSPSSTRTAADPTIRPRKSESGDCINPSTSRLYSRRYNPVTGEGAIGVEFAGTAVTSSSSFGKIPPAAADVISRDLVDGDTNLNLQWSAGFYRGFFTLTIDTESIKATYYAMRNISYPNLDAFVSAHFVVQAGANKLQRPVAGGEENVKAGTLKINGTKSNQMRTDTKSSRW
ncbi:hypothetical protein PM082_012914 [Marasmius tenuissimus]|nr:hypothetical protein PM082_012914 [Marasmius tenuissimus]